MLTKPLKAPQTETALKPAGIVPPPQIESFVYRGMEAKARGAAVAYEQNLHKGVFVAYLGAWVALFAIFAVSFANSPYTLFMIVIGALNGVALFGVPIVCARAGKWPTSSLAFGDFLCTEVATASGPLSGAEALAQVVMVPACLATGALAMAYIMHVDYLNVLAEVAAKTH